jgi:four helix bundle protein
MAVSSTSRKILRHQELEVYKKAFNAAMRIFEITKSIRRSSRSVCANIAEAWRKRRYEAAFISKINDAEGEAAETQTWLEFSVKCVYLDKEIGRELFIEYDEIIAMLVSMMSKSHLWVLPTGRKETR